MQTVEELTERFRAQGLRVTPQRQAVFAALHGNDGHPTVEAIHERVSSAMPTISLRTVYQTVHDLEALGEVRLLDVGLGSIRVDPNVEAEHHHLVCTACGRVRDVQFAADQVPPLPRSVRGEFHPTSVEVVFRGVCDTCLRP